MTHVAAHDNSATKPPRKDAPQTIPPPKPALTKAERKAKQEKERETKAAAKAANLPGNNNRPGTASKPAPKASNAASSSQATKPPKLPDVSKTAPPKDIPSVIVQSIPEVQDQTRGLRIFSHFGSPKPSASSNLKGPLHPAIFRLALQFSSFQIVGANARCIAALNAFKTVSVKCDEGS